MALSILIFSFQFCLNCFSSFSLCTSLKWQLAWRFFSANHSSHLIIRNNLQATFLLLSVQLCGIRCSILVWHFLWIMCLSQCNCVDSAGYLVNFVVCAVQSFMCMTLSNNCWHALLLLSLLPVIIPPTHNTTLHNNRNRIAIAIQYIFRYLLSGYRYFFVGNI